MKRFLLILLLAIGCGHSTAFAQFYTIGRSMPKAHIKTGNPSTQSDSVSEDSVAVPKIVQIDSVSITQSYPGVSLPLRKIQINSSFGWRKDPFTSKRTWHNGIDLQARDDLAMSMLNGVVVRTGKDNRSGVYVVLRHGNFEVSYCHLSKILVKKESRVVTGQPIGITGNTGRSTGPHLHRVTKKDGQAFDPTIFLDYVSNTINSL